MSTTTRMHITFAAWAIRQKSTGKYLPCQWNGMPRSYSYDESEHGFPRLFKSKRSALSALHAWLHGVHKLGRAVHLDIFGPLFDTVPVPGRNAADMEIVEFYLVEGRAAEIDRS